MLQLDAARRELRNSHLILSEFAGAAKTYQRRCDEILAGYRGQRAWKLMLTARAIYHHLFCCGWQGRFRFLKEFPRLLSAEGLQAMELDFPKLEEFIPSIVHQYLDESSDSYQHPSLVYPQHKTDYIILPIIDFRFRFQRPQQLAQQLARRGHRVFWVNPNRCLPPHAPVPYECHRLQPSLHELEIKGTACDIYRSELTPEITAQYLAALRHFYRDYAISDSVLMVQFPFWRRLAEAVRAEFGSPMIYDCMDDWDPFENVGAFARAEEPALAAAADLLIVSAQRLQEKFAGRGLAPVLVRNGADVDFYQSSTASELLDDIPRPIAGYFGAIADWFDLDLMERVARSRPQYSFVLIGQVFGLDTSRLQSLANVHLLGLQPYEKLPGYLRRFDACLIPFLINDVTRSTDPVKLYEYFALGKPVVSTGLDELEHCRDLLYLAGDAAGFAAQLDAAIAEHDPGIIQRRIDFAAANTWAQRTGIIEDAMARRTPLISILIVTFNSAEFIEPCLDSIRRHTSYANYEVLIVDNASTDTTPDICRRFAASDERLRFFALDANLGFAGGNNYAAARAAGEFIVLLNADTMVTSGWLTRLRNHFHADAPVGLVCAVTNFSGNETKVNINCLTQEQMEISAMERASALYRQSLDLTMAPLFCVMLRKSLFDELGGLDERYEVGMFEDDDFSLMVRRAGKRIIAADDCYVHHFGQGSFSQLPAPHYQELFERNRRVFEQKWGITWSPHRTRPRVTPAHLDKPIPPSEFRTAGSPAD